MADVIAELERAAHAGDASAEGQLLRLQHEASRDGDDLADAQASHALAWICERAGRRMDAQRHYLRAADLRERAGDHPLAVSTRILWLTVAVAWLPADRAAEIVSTLAREPLPDGDRHRLVMIEARLARAAGDPQRARSLLRAETERNGRSLDLEHQLAMLALDAGEFEAAWEHLGRALALGPKGAGLASTLINLADAARGTGRAAEAGALLAEAETLPMAESSRIVLAANRALLLADAGDAAEALALLERTLGDPAIGDSPRLRFVVSALAAGQAASCGRAAATASHLTSAWAGRGPGRTGADLPPALDRAATFLRSAGRPSEHVRARLLAWSTRRDLGLAGLPELEALALDLPRAGPIPLDAVDLLRPLGAGGMGEVWEGVHPATGARLAVKLVTTGGPGLAEALRAEIRQVAALDHPNVVPLLDAGEVTPEVAVASGGRLQAGTPWLAMPLFVGGSLGPYCGRLEWRGVKPLLLDLLAGLGHAHARGVVHLDVKPHNALLEGAPGAALLADFGLAQAIAGSGRERRVVGTPGYMAPEQRRGRRRDFGPWTDLYAVGGVAWALLCGRAPHGSGTAGTDGLPPLLSAVALPEGVAEWVAWLGEAHVSGRPSFAAEAEAALRGLADRAEAEASGPLPTAGADDDATFALADLDTAEIQEPVSPRGVPRATPAPALASSAPLRPPRLAPPGLGLAALRHRRPSLVGRDREVGILWDALREMAAGAGVNVRIQGASGTGRTALLEVLVEHAHVAGFAVLTGSSSDGPADPILRHLRADGLQGAALEAQVTRAWMQAGAARPDLVLTAARSADPADTVAALAALAAARPTLLAFDDLGGPLEAVARAHARAPGACVAVVSSDPLPDERLVAIGPLSDADVQRLVGSLIVASGELTSRVVEAARGYPGFVLRVLARWREDGLLWSGPEGVAPLAGIALGPPASEAELARARVDRLTRDLTGGREALELLAVLGAGATAAEWDTACRASGLPDPAELRLRLARAGEGPPVPPWLAGPLLVDLGGSGRFAGLARTAADAIGDGPGSSLRRARLLDRAGDREAAAEALLAAGRERLGARDPVQALAIADEADALLGGEPAGSERRLQSAWLRGSALIELDRPAAALTHIVGVPRPDAAWRVRFLRVEARARRDLGQIDAAEATLRRALAEAPPAEVPQLRQSLALVRARQGARDEAIAILAELADAGLADALLDLSRMLRMAGRPADALAALDRYVTPTPAAAARVEIQRALVAQSLGQSDEVARRFEAVLQLAVPRGPEWNLAVLWLAVAADEAGRTAEVLSLVLPMVVVDTRARVLAVSATASEPPGRCDEWIAGLRDAVPEAQTAVWDPLESTCRHASLSIL